VKVTRDARTPFGNPAEDTGVTYKGKALNEFKFELLLIEPKSSNVCVDCKARYFAV
jgi:hypothetical protein